MRVSKFTSVGTVNSVQRHTLRFETREALDEAVKINNEVGFFLFRKDGTDLVGRIVRVAPGDLVIEVDAAKDSERELELL